MKLSYTTGTKRHVYKIFWKSKNDETWQRTLEVDTALSSSLNTSGCPAGF